MFHKTELLNKNEVMLYLWPIPSQYLKCLGSELLLCASQLILRTMVHSYFFLGKAVSGLLSTHGCAEKFGRSCFSRGLPLFLLFSSFENPVLFASIMASAFTHSCQAYASYSWLLTVYQFYIFPIIPLILPIDFFSHGS